MEKVMCDDPANKSGPEMLNFYTKKAQKKMQTIREQIVWLMQEKRRAAGGVSGGQRLLRTTNEQETLT